MKNLIIDRTASTPEVIFDVDKKTLSLKGNSLPENPTEFYMIIDDYINEYLIHQSNKLFIICDITYMNSSSNKRIFQLIKKCVAMFNVVNITWIYDVNDDDMREQGEDFEHSLGIKFNFQSKQ
jgi:hypothetical protein